MTDHPTETPPPAPSNDTMAQALARHHIELPDDQQQLLDRYAKLLWDWNEKINLTRHTTFEKFVSRDLVDTLWLAKFIDAGDRVLDVGTGGGVPGIVLAIIRPDLEVTLSDSVQKKARVAADIVQQLELPIQVHAGAAQDLLKTKHFDTLVARAVAPLPKLLGWFDLHWDAFSQLLVIKGPAWVEERAEARHRGLFKSLELRKLGEYPLPDTDSRSVVLGIRPADTK
jgi:16S rRNA (guanine527-N7)-methyltransferase